MGGALLRAGRAQEHADFLNAIRRARHAALARRRPRCSAAASCFRRRCSRRLAGPASRRAGVQRLVAVAEVRRARAVVSTPGTARLCDDDAACGRTRGGTGSVRRPTPPSRSDVSKPRRKLPLRTWERVIRRPRHARPSRHRETSPARPGRSVKLPLGLVCRTRRVSRPEAGIPSTLVQQGEGWAWPRWRGFVVAYGASRRRLGAGSGISAAPLPAGGAPGIATRASDDNDYVVLDCNGSVRLAPPHSRWDRANRDAVSDV